MKKSDIKKAFDNKNWTSDTIVLADKIVSKISSQYLGLDVYPNQFEIVTSEQMLDSYSLIGLPLSYDHWKFGKDFVINQNQYKKGKMGLAYELVINSNPCISYNMEDNTTCLMVLVLAHAAYGHNHFFKNNYLFKQWTDAESIIDYMVFARGYIKKCEDKYGIEDVERVLDACHSLMNYGVDKYRKPSNISIVQEKERLNKKIFDDRILLNDIWRTIPKEEIKSKIKNYPDQPEENILYFIEKNSPKLKEWQREIIRIVRKISQYFYPQSQTKVTNEGCATFTHYEIVNKMFEDGYLSDGFMLEFFHHHSNVIYQPSYDMSFYSGLNPYTLGFNIFSDIKRLVTNPTKEDKKWFPDISGSENWQEIFRYIVENFKDETFILQYLSPRVIRDMKLFVVDDNKDNDFYEVSNIHNDEGYKKIREDLSSYFNRSRYVPDIQVLNVDVQGDRKLTLKYTPINGKVLDNKITKKIIPHIEYLWGFPVEII